MRPLFWAEAAALALVAALLASPALAQKQPAEAPPRAAIPPAAPPIPVAVDPPPAPPTPSVITAPSWVERPTPHDFGRYYPQAALDALVNGSATLDCLVAADGRLACTVTREEPGGFGFGEAALRLARHFRMAQETRDGQRTAGGRVRVPMRFFITDETPPVEP